VTGWWAVRVPVAGWTEPRWLVLVLAVTLLAAVVVGAWKWDLWQHLRGSDGQVRVLRPAHPDAEDFGGELAGRPEGLATHPEDAQGVLARLGGVDPEPGEDWGDTVQRIRGDLMAEETEERIAAATDSFTVVADPTTGQLRAIKDGGNGGFVPARDGVRRDEQVRDGQAAGGASAGYGGHGDLLRHSERAAAVQAPSVVAYPAPRFSGGWLVVNGLPVFPTLLDQEKYMTERQLSQDAVDDLISAAYRWLDEAFAA
jgi:hypothetical protein